MTLFYATTTTSNRQLSRWEASPLNTLVDYCACVQQDLDKVVSQNWPLERVGCTDVQVVGYATGVGKIAASIGAG
jgi:hypothetical protein